MSFVWLFALVLHTVVSEDQLLWSANSSDHSWDGTIPAFNLKREATLSFRLLGGPVQVKCTHLCIPTFSHSPMVLLSLTLLGTVLRVLNSVFVCSLTLPFLQWLVSFHCTLLTHQNWECADENTNATCFGSPRNCEFFKTFELTPAGESFKFWPKIVEYLLRPGEKSPAFEVSLFGELCEEYSYFSNGNACLLGRQLQPDIDVKFRFMQDQVENLFFFDLPPFTGEVIFNSTEVIPGYVVYTL